MNKSKNDSILKYYPLPITKEKNKKITDQMENYICKIKIKNKEGTGFFCQFLHQNQKIYALIISSHILDDNILKEHKIINIILNDDKEYKNIEINENKNIYTSTNYDITIIEIKPESDNIHYFLELDDILYNDNLSLSNDSIYILHYQKFNNEHFAAVSYGILDNMDDNNLKLYCNTGINSKGAPILRLSSNKVIGVLKENIQFNYNSGIILKKSIDEFLNNIKKNNQTLLANEPNENKKENTIQQEPKNEVIFYGPEAGEEEGEEEEKKPKKTILGPEVEDEDEIVSKKANIQSIQNDIINTIYGPETLEEEKYPENDNIQTTPKIKNDIMDIKKEKNQKDENINNNQNQNLIKLNAKTGNSSKANKIETKETNIMYDDLKNLDINKMLNSNSDKVEERKSLSNTCFNNNNKDNDININANYSDKNLIQINKNQGFNNNSENGSNDVSTNLIDNCYPNKPNWNLDNNMNLFSNMNNININNNNFNPSIIQNFTNRNTLNFNTNQNNFFNDNNNIKKNNLSQIYSFSRYKIVSRTGLKDLGNTSYLNAALQLLGNIRGIANFLLNPANVINPNAINMVFTYYIQRLFIHLYPYPEKINIEIYEPKYILKYLNKYNINKNPNNIFKCILINLHNELNIIRNNNKKVISNHFDRNNVIKNEINNINNSNNSIIYNIFNFFKIKESLCSICNQKSYELKTYNIFELDILNCFNNNKKNNYITIQNCLQYSQQIKRENYYCENCRKFWFKFNMSKIYSSPNYFIFSLDRGNLDQNLLNVNFLVEDKINLNNFIELTNTPRLYELTGIVSIYMNEKRYVCCCKSPVDNQWYYYDNENVSNVDFNIVMKNHNNCSFIPCLLLYKSFKKK